jgi:putative Mn2+ efflux pump MntP
MDIAFIIAIVLVIFSGLLAILAFIDNKEDEENENKS